MSCLLRRPSALERATRRLTSDRLDMLRLEMLHSPPLRAEESSARDRPSFHPACRSCAFIIQPVDPLLCLLIDPPSQRPSSRAEADRISPTATSHPPYLLGPARGLRLTDAPPGSVHLGPATDSNINYGLADARGSFAGRTLAAGSTRHAARCHVADHGPAPGLPIPSVCARGASRDWLRGAHSAGRPAGQPTASG